MARAPGVITRGTARELAEKPVGLSASGVSEHTRHTAHGGRAREFDPRPEPRPGQEVLRGEVLFVWSENNRLVYGFIRPAHSNGARENNVWFGARAAWDETIKKGDLVEYVLSKTYDKGPAAERVTVKSKAK